MVAPPGKKFGTVVRPSVRFGAPLDFSRYEGLAGDRYILRSVTDEIMYEIMRLSGQEYVDVYAPKAKELAAKAKEEAKRAERAAREKAAHETAQADGDGADSSEAGEGATGDGAAGARTAGDDGDSGDGVGDRKAAS